ncbi:putative KRAB-A domain-containing protein 2, partial [Daphnia magna]
MPFGLCSAPSTFQRLMDMVLAGLKWTDCLVYMDDVVIFEKDAKEHLERLGKVLSCFRKANLKLKMEKCAFGIERVRMLGHVVSKAGIEPDPEHCKAIEMFPGPNLNANEKAKRKWVKSFVGLCSFYRKFVPNFAQVAYPLTVMEGKGVFRWGESERNGFSELKAALLKAAQLAHPDYSKNFEVHPDACDYGIGAALMQERNGNPMPICFAVKKFRPYIWGTKIVIKTDHHALCWLMTKQELSGRLERWSLSLQEYDISIHYKKGSLHDDADALSRYPIQERGEEEQAEAIPVATIGLDTRSWVDGQDRVKQWRWIKQVMIKNGSTQYGNFMLKDGLLYLRTIRFGQEFDRLCVPPERRKEALSWVHDEPTAGHLGQTKTLERARHRFYWPKMDRAVTRYVQSCKSCQTRKPDQGKKKGLIEITQVGGPFERIGIDVLGPFPRSRNGNTNIVVAVDYLTKWVEARALPDATARQIAKFFVEDVVVRHGFPRELTSDQGKCFTAEVTREVLALLRLSHRMTVPYHQQANGLVERQNKTLATMLAMYVDESHEDWDEFLGFVTFAYNTARQESTNHTPFMMVYGREAVIP